jgi:Leucine-rich repeat (LRR) protein
MKARRNNTIKGVLALLLLLAGMSVQAQTNVVPDDVEFQALKALYDNTGGANWTNKTNWPVAGSWPATATAAQMATWYGVTVVNGDVTRVVLNSNNLTGTLPAALSQLTQLTQLQLVGNTGLAGSIPTSLGSLTNLQTLYLAGSKLSGSIPAELGNLTNLTYLGLNGNQLSGAIPSSLGNLTKLNYLYLYLNQLSGGIPAEIGNLTNLLDLELHNNQLTGSIPSSMGNLTKLVNLYLYGNQLTGSIPSTIGNLTNLTTLYLYSNQLTGNIPAELGNLSSLAYLQLQGNKLNGFIPATLGNLANLTLLYLNGNQLGGAIPAELGNLSKLVSLFLYSNQLSGSIPSSLGNLTKLQVLYLQGNQLSGTIPASLGSLSNLTQLYASNNQLTGEIPSALGGLTKLQILYLNSNQLSGSIPSSFGNLGSLTQLYLFGNKLSGTIPASMGSLTKLQILSVYSNQLSGPLPAELSGLTGLTTFYAYSNQITGNLPAITNWGNVTQIQIQNNLMSGDVPSVAGCTKLSLFYGYGNQFTSLPASMLSLNLLISVNFSSNALVSIPNFANHSNKANLTLTINANYLDYTQLEPLIGTGIKSITYSPQNNINDVTSMNLTLGSDLVFTARPKGASTSNIIWQKLNGDGATWTNISSSNADDVAGITYRIPAATTAAEGKYRWYCTSTVATAFTLTSTPIEVKAPVRFTLDNLAFQYRYDGRNRMVAKRVPGADWVYMIYDKRDRLVLSQDGNLRASNQWLFTKYDALNRPVMTGIYTHTAYADTAAMNKLISTTSFAETFSATGNHGYTNNVFPTTNLDIRTVTYYDNYNYRAAWGNEYAYATNQVDPVTVNGVTYSQPSASNMQVIGKVTGTKVRTSPNDPYWLQTATYYDDKYRVIQVVSDNNKGGIDITSSIYDFPGKVLATKTTHNISAFTWQNMVGVKVDGNNLVKTATTNNWGVAGASSVQQIPAGADGWVEATVTEITTNKMIGLSDQDTDQNYPSIDYAFHLSLNNLVVFIGGVNKGTVATISTGDRLRIAREGGNMIFYRNGVKVYPTGTATLPCSTLLMADASIYQLGATLGRVRISAAPGPQRTITRRLEYDHAQRPTKVWHSVNGSIPVLLVQNEYNEIGQLVTKKLHSTDNGSRFKQVVDQRYNIRGWLTRINNSDLSPDNVSDPRDYFGLTLSYHDIVSGINNTPQYNGNISAVRWSNNQGFGNLTERAYKFSQDPLNRLLAATHLEKANGWSASSSYHENNLTYDDNGNILTLSRNGVNGLAQDILSYNYGTGSDQGNKLLNVSDAGDKLQGFADGVSTKIEYTYDVNGNMITDPNRGVSGITYTHLNLVQKATKTTGESIQFVSDATGNNLSESEYNASGVLKKKSDFVGEFYYENDTLKFIHHPEGRVVMTGTQPEYQYHLKDHLNNVRMTFTTKRNVDQPIATFETANIASEQSQFLRMDAARLINASIFDHTQNGITNYSERLNGTPNEVNGVARSISVMPGDTINMEVYAKYVDPNNSSNTAALTQFLAQIAAGSASAGTVIDGANYATSGTVPFSYAGLLTYPTGSSAAPKAYLNYLVFDRNYAFVTGGYVPVSTAAKEDGTNVQHEHLTQQIVINQPGYVYIYLSNDNVVLGGQAMEVYFDDLKVVQIKNPVLQTDDYMPFGLTFNSFSREGAMPNDWKFQGQRQLNSLKLGWTRFKYRNGLSDLGRFFNVDPLAEKYYYNSTYAFSENKVTSHFELEGLESISIQLRSLEPRREGPSKFAALQYGPVSSSFSMTVNLANKSLITNCSNVTSERKNGTTLTSNKDGSLTIQGSMGFGSGRGAAAFSVTITNNIEKDGSLNMKSAITGTNTQPLEMAVSGTTNGQENFDSALINTVPINRTGGFSLLNSTTPQEGLSNTDLKIKQGAGSDVTIERAKDNGAKNYKDVIDFNKQKESTPTVKKDN